MAGDREQAAEIFSAKQIRTTTIRDVANTGSAITFTAPITMDDSKNLAFGTSNGTKIGTSVNAKIGFWNTTPVIQPGHIADPGFSGTDTLTDADGSLGATTQAELEGVLQNFGDQIKLILADLAEIGLQAAS